MNRFYCILLIFTLLANMLFAQRDSIYISSYERKISTKEFLYSNLMQLSINNKSKSQDVKYVPNNPSGIGFGIIYGNLLLSINSGLNFNQYTGKNYNRTKYNDIQLHRFGKKYAADLFVQQYRGFYIENKEIDINKMDCPDLKILQTGIVGQYIFNSNKFSYRAAFYQNEKQLKSAGSFLLGGGFYYFRINSDSTFIVGNEKYIESYQWGINAGYAYNKVINKHWLASGSMTAGINVGNKKLNSFFNNAMYINPTFLPRFSISYNSENWSLGALYVGNIMLLVNPKESKIELSSGRFEVAFFHRLSFEPVWMKKKQLAISN
jgi:hypothetical protein